jgi:hypothetical protein
LCGKDTGSGGLVVGRGGVNMLIGRISGIGRIGRISRISRTGRIGRISRISRTGRIGRISKEGEGGVKVCKA